MSSANVRKNKQRAELDDLIVIDEEKNLVFDTEEALYQHFFREIETLEADFLEHKKSTDISLEKHEDFEQELNETLEKPHEIWTAQDLIPGVPVNIYVRKYGDESAGDLHHHVAVTYLTQNTPTFIYLHFPTIDKELVDHYRRGELIFNRSAQDVSLGAIEGDALFEGDELASGLYNAMLLLRSDDDISETEFQRFGELREESVESADEIWKSHDSVGNTLVTFIKDLSESETEELYYVVVTLEDSGTNTHSLLFSFPTNDSSLADRYRHGENMQAEEVVQEASH